MRTANSCGAFFDVSGRAIRAAIVGLTLWGVAGCGTGATIPDGNGGSTVIGGNGGTTVIDGNRDTTLTSPLGKTSGEPNDTFASAVVAVFDGVGVARLQGTVPQEGDLDVFLLGSLTAGDRVIVDADTTGVGSALDVSVAIFDALERLVVNNDDRADNDLDSWVDWITRHDSPSYYLVVTHSAFAPAGRFTGSYRVDVQVTSGSTVPAPVGQRLLLDFSGGFVDSPTLGTVSIDPFSAAAISDVYRGQDEVLKEAIRRSVEQNFERFNVTVLTSDDPPPGIGVPLSTIFFGGFNSSTFGIAEDVDLYNTDFCDDAIIYTESFAPQVFSRTPTAAELGIAIGNIAAHEAGHLLGLNHVDDDRALMDDQSAADVFLMDQEFIEALLSADIMPIGTQDAVLLLRETVDLRSPF